uniref:Uncharacterized protein n=1 Tax=Peromyscus maniculatus bairdii TaxID=230844 RepID=A0A8C8UEA0_PERMB
MAPPVRFCIPGERLCDLEEGRHPGSGTYTGHRLHLFIAGRLPEGDQQQERRESQLLPDVGAAVTCKVSSLSSHFAKVHILYVGSTPLKNAFRGTIRKEDIRATEKSEMSRWLPSVGVRCSVRRPTLKNSSKWPECSLSSYKSKHTLPQ